VRVAKAWRAPTSIEGPCGGQVTIFELESPALAHGRGKPPRLSYPIGSHWSHSTFRRAMHNRSAAKHGSQLLGQQINSTGEHHLIALIAITYETFYHV